MITDHIVADRRSASRAVDLPPDIGDVRSTVENFEHRARTLITQQPVLAVMAAVGVGYLVARLVARGTR
jgi:hypothetical protein